MSVLRKANSESLLEFTKSQQKLFPKTHSSLITVSLGIRGFLEEFKPVTFQSRTHLCNITHETKPFHP